MEFINKIECLNRVELRGIIGNAKITRVGDIHVARLSVATDYCYKNRDGETVIETTWHNVTVWEKPGQPLENLVKGAAVHLTGRLRNNRYTAADGTERICVEIIAGSIEVIPKAA